MPRVDWHELITDDEGRIYFYGEAPFTGVACETLPDGTRVEVPMVGGREEGLTRKWSPSGILLSEISVLGDRQHGPARHWSADGALLREAWYEYGVCVSAKEFDVNGRVVSSFTISPDSPDFRQLEWARSVNWDDPAVQRLLLIRNAPDAEPPG